MTVERFFINEAKKAYEIDLSLKGELEVAGFSHADVKKTPLGTRIIIYALRPGLVIGSGGENIKRLTRVLGAKFGLENPHLEVEQVTEPFLDAQIVAWRIARAIERGAYFKRIANIMLNRVMQAGAKGVEIRLGGKLPSSRARTWIFVDGKLRKCGQEAVDQVDRGYMKALTKPGIIGVTVSILPPDIKFSDDIHEKPIPAPQAEKEEASPKEKEEKPEVKVKETAQKPEEKKSVQKSTKKAEAKKEKPTKETTEEKKPSKKVNAKVPKPKSKAS